ncbi:unnamed protein product [Lymnaea stagnalis]|uniref:TNFR-Cys domain-containing protein n=1 Tax=Lymnaea stagnalis TaxID=6523 RepID=A0AAV2HVC0_LYMST
MTARMHPEVILAMLMLKTVSPCGVCDPDIPSRTRPPSQMVASSYRGPLPSCRPGEYIHGQSGACTPCANGSFVTAEMVSFLNNMACMRCQEPSEHEVLINPCATTVDSEILCKPGFYRPREEGENCICTSRCVTCSTCGAGSNLDLGYEGRPCGKHDDVMCCKWEAMVVIDDVCMAVELKSEQKLTFELGDGNSVSFLSVSQSVMLLCMLSLTFINVII